MTVSVCQLIFYGRITENSAAGVSAVSCLHFDLRKKADAFLHHSPPPRPPGIHGCPSHGFSSIYLITDAMLIYLQM